VRMRTHFGAVWEAIADAVPQQAAWCRGIGAWGGGTTSSAPPGWHGRCSMRASAQARR
jgi:hypothetical protein